MRVIILYGTCMHIYACSPPHPHAQLCDTIHATTRRTAHHNTHYTYTSLLLYTTAHAHTLQHTQPNPNTLQHTHDYVQPACHRDHDETGDHQQTTQTHITPNAITTTTMTMCDDDHVTMPILPCVRSYHMARDDDGDGAQCIHIQHNAHTLDSHMLSSAHPHQHAHYTYIYHLLYNRTPTHIATHPTPNTLQHYTRNYVRPARATAITTRPETRDSTDTHHTPTAITTTMTMCDDM